MFEQDFDMWLFYPWEDVCYFECTERWVSCVGKVWVKKMRESHEQPLVLVASASVNCSDWEKTGKGP